MSENKIITQEPLVKVEDLCMFFHVARHQTLKAVNHVSFEIQKGQTVGLVGESGCGKSTTGRCLVRLHEPTSGHIYYKGKDISHLNKEERKKFTGDVQMIFQNPYSSLNPRMTVKEIVGEGMKIHGEYHGALEQDIRVEELLTKVGLGKEHMSRFAHEFSGGQRQRIGIARALSVNPEFIVCDEPISALDVSIQAQVINLLKDYQEEQGTSYLFIAHDLSMVRYVSDDVGVMYLGQLVELSEADEIYKHPLHPYTKGLLGSIPVANPKLARKKVNSSIEGDIPSPINPPTGCRFHTRCPYAKPE